MRDYWERQLRCRSRRTLHVAGSLSRIPTTRCATSLPLDSPARGPKTVPHSFAPGASSGEPATDRPDNAFPSAGGYYSSGSTSGVTMPAPSNVGAAGGSQPHNNIQPVLALNFIISPFGIFPSQS